MRARCMTVFFALIAATCVAAPAGRAQEPTLAPGMMVVGRSADFVLRDGKKVVHVATPFDTFRVGRVQGDRIHLHADGREGDARAGEIVPIEKAEAYFSEQIKANPHASHAYLMRSVIGAASRRDWAGALPDCEHAIRLDPKNPWAYLVRGEIKAQQGDLKDAIADFEQGIRLDPKIARSFTFKAQCYLEAGESDKVLAELNEAIRRDANEVEAYVLRGHAWQQKGDASQALRAYNEAIRVAPRSAVAYIARAEYYGACEDFDKALADANEAIRLDPIAEAYITRAHVACCRGDLKTAVADLGEAIRLDPKDIRVASCSVPIASSIVGSLTRRSKTSTKR